jgi:hypothetical protein
MEWICAEENKRIDVGEKTQFIYNQFVIKKMSHPIANAANVMTPFRTCPRRLGTKKIVAGKTRQLFKFSSDKESSGD